MLVSICACTLGIFILESKIFARKAAPIPSIFSSLVSNKDFYNFLYIQCMFRFSDPDSLFVKATPILTAVHNRSAEIACRPSSSQAKMTLYQVDPKTGQHLEMPYEVAGSGGWAVAGSEIEASRESEPISKTAAVQYSPRRGFLLATINNDRLICRARLAVEDEEVKQQDNSIIIQYTSE